MGAFWGALAALGIGASDLFGRRVSNGASPLTAALAMQVVGMCTALVSVLFFSSEFGAVDMMWGGLSGLGMASGLGCYYAGLRNSSATVVAPTVATLAAVIPFVYAIVRGDDVSGLALIGAALAFIGIAVIAAGTGDPTKLKDGMTWGVLSGLGYGAGISMLVEVSDDAGVWPAVSQRFVAAIVLGCAAVLAKSVLVPPAGLRVSGFMAGIFAGLASVFGLIGIVVDAPPAVVTQSMFPIVSVVVGFLYFNDAVVRRQVFGIALAMAGVIGVVAG